MNSSGDTNLHASDPAFVAKWWNAHDVRSGASGQKFIAHPKRGVLRYEYATF